MTGHVRLVRDLASPFERAAWPAGVRLVPFSGTLAPAAHKLLLECYRDGFGSVPAAFDTWWAATRHDPEFDANLCLCATCDGRLVGFALCWTSAFIKDLVVAPEFSRKGIGEALLRQAFSTFRERGADQVALKTETGNAAALRLYARMGFRP